MKKKNTYSYKKKIEYFCVMKYILQTKGNDQ